MSIFNNIRQFWHENDAKDILAKGSLTIVGLLLGIVLGMLVLYATHQVLS